MLKIYQGIDCKEVYIDNLCVGFIHKEIGFEAYFEQSPMIKGLSQTNLQKILEVMKNVLH